MYPQGYLYSEDHEWFEIEGDTCTLGITHFAQDELGEVVFVELPEVGQSVEAGDEIGTVESVKAVSEIYTAVAGEVIAVNEELVDVPERLNEDPHGAAWLVKLKVSSPKVGGLMDAEAYEAFTRGG